MESPDQNRNMSGSSSRTPFTLDVLIMLHQARVQQISTCIDQHVENNSCICVNALERNNSWGGRHYRNISGQLVLSEVSKDRRIILLQKHRVLSQTSYLELNKEAQLKSSAWFFNRHSSHHACTFVWNVHKVVCNHGNGYLTVVDKKRQAIHLD